MIKVSKGNEDDEFRHQENVVKQEREDMDMKRVWYAVQEQSSDGWDYGSYNINEAVAMLKEQGHGLIAAIDEENQFCMDELAYDELITE